MKVLATVSTFLFFTCTFAGNLPSGCYNGAIDAKTCCTGISEWYVHLPDPENCGKFYQCDNGKAVHKDCPATLHWSVAADRCEWPDKADCNISKDQCEPKPTNPKCISGEISPDTCCLNVKTYYKLALPNSNDCSSYYKCVDGKAVLQQCPEGLHWSIQSERCEYPVDAQCEDNTTPYPGHNVSQDCLYGKVSAEQCCKGVPYWVDVLLQNNNDCHTYIQCVHQKPMVRPCPAGLWWSVTMNRCEWKKNATCTW